MQNLSTTKHTQTTHIGHTQIILSLLHYNILHLDSKAKYFHHFMESSCQQEPSNEILLAKIEFFRNSYTQAVYTTLSFYGFIFRIWVLISSKKEPGGFNFLRQYIINATTHSDILRILIIVFLAVYSTPRHQYILSLSFLNVIIKTCPQNKLLQYYTALFLFWHSPRREVLPFEIKLEFELSNLRHHHRTERWRKTLISNLLNWNFHII